MTMQPDRIIHMLYEAAASEEDWYKTACVIGDQVGAGPIHLFLCSLETGREYVNFLARGNPDFAAEYLDDYAATDFRVPRVMAHKAGAYIDERSYVTREEAAGSAIHQEFLPRQEIYNISGTNLTHDGCIGWFGLSTRGPGHDFDDRQRAFLSSISGHVFRAMKLYRNRQDLVAERDLASQTLDLVNTGILILAGSQVLESNATFDRLLEDRFFLLRNDSLTCSDPVQAAKLQHHLAGDRDHASQDCLVLRHPEAGVTYLVQCHALSSPLPGPQRRQTHQAVSILKLDLDEQPDLEEVTAFCGSYGVSRAEAMVMRAVLASQHLSAFAEDRGIRLDTVQKQLKSAMRKTELNSQKKIFQAFERYRLMKPQGRS
tara:strand:- start:5328 stop:6446 length:1119 start_codon:yes stop_codon:yes gene_type:complete